MTVIGRVVVVAVLGGIIQQLFSPEVIVTVEILSIASARFMETLFVEHMDLEGRQGIGNGAQAHPLDIGGVVAGTAGIVVPPGVDAVIDEQGEKRHRHLAGIDLLDDVVARILISMK
jgi:hypothetical protein